MQLSVAGRALNLKLIAVLLEVPLPTLAGDWGVLREVGRERQGILVLKDLPAEDVLQRYVVGQVVGRGVDQGRVPLLVERTGVCRDVARCPRCETREPRKFVGDCTDP